MPVLIAAVNRDLDIVVPLAEKLLNGGGEVRCFLEFDDHELRSMGCKIAVGDLGDAYTMGAALTNVHTFIPLLADPLSFAADLGQLTAFGRAAAEAAETTHLGQTILPISSAGGGGHPIFETLRAIEEDFRGSVEPLCVLKTRFLAGQDRPLRLAGLEDAQYEVSAISVENLIAAIAGADDREGIEETQNLDSKPMRVKLETGLNPAISGFFTFPLALASSRDKGLEYEIDGG